MLSKTEIRELIEKHGMITGYTDLDTQLQPNGFDLCIKSLRRVYTSGQIDFDNSQRVISDSCEVPVVNVRPVPAWYLYEATSYIAEIAETVNLPSGIAALTFARSSLMRCGISISNAVWDRGYCGRGTVGLSTSQPVHILPGARILQMVFFRVNDDGAVYNGIYQGEGK